MKDYVCTICGREHVKLWRPYMDTEPLICATCAEERQSPCKYNECTWEWKENCGAYIGTPTGKKIPLAKWSVDEKGKIPSYSGPGPEGVNMQKTDQLIVSLKDVSGSYVSGRTTMIPAVPCEENGSFWGYTSVPEERCNWWRNLPTR